MAALVTPAAASAALVSEMMAQGRKSAAALEALLQVQDHAGIRDLTAEILRCCDRALAALHGKQGRNKRKSPSHGGAATQTKSKRRTGASSGEATTAARVERKRNWDDGFMWTKYGQKDIRGRDHPRHYFRCAYALDAGGCPARRQVQRSEGDDPPLYVLTYFGDHTCRHHGDMAAVLEDVKTIQPPLILDFGSAGSRSPLPEPDGVDVQSGNTSRAESEEVAAEVGIVDSMLLADFPPPAGQVAELSLSADGVRSRCSSSLASADPSAAVCYEWDYAGDCSFDYVSEFFDSEDIALYR
ncbi:transcription factor WRKY45-2-like [Triticum urartu]|uniref:transcription factor WRKY45-2-like n=1 Tax=Triticum urartu TaxID=4572 RepID=UPI002043C96A|nr:transcription factor WRKY45-2-like [Triticum urartu]